MKYEVEQKFRLAVVSELRQRVADLGGHFSSPVIQTDTYFAHPTRDFAKTDEALRIRCVGSQTYMTYKGPKIDADTKTRCEVELPLLADPDSPAVGGQLLEALGFRKVMTVRKQRRSAQLTCAGWTVAVDLDSIDGLGEFVELEILAEESELNSARQCILTLAGQLGLSGEERRSYLELLLDG